MSPNYSCRCGFLEDANVTHGYPKSAQGQWDLTALTSTSVLPFLATGEYLSDSIALLEWRDLAEAQHCDKANQPLNLETLLRATLGLQSQQL